MSSIHIPPIPSIKMVTSDGYPTIEEGIWRQQELFTRSPWTAYTPTTAHLTAITINDCAYVQAGKWTAVRIRVKGTSDGTAATITLPFLAKSGGQTFATANGNNGVAGFSLIGGDLQTLTVLKYDGSAPVNTVVQDWIITGVYEAQ